MFIYSKRIVRFIEALKGIVKQVLYIEVGLQVSGNRFYDRRGWSSYPINIVAFNDRNSLGYFDPEFYELGFHLCLIHADHNRLFNVVRHELAHYIQFINEGHVDHFHGPTFRELCKGFGWGEEVYRATMKLDEEAIASPAHDSALLRRIQKLMALSSSTNQHEAELAMIKAQQLLMKHNIEAGSLDEANQEQYHLKRILKSKRQNAKMNAIARILATFFVSTVYIRVKDYTYLEILGRPHNVEIAEYVAHFLDRELDALWQQAKRQYGNLKGQTAKNSFFRGIARGYNQKIEALKRQYTDQQTASLMLLENQLERAQEMAYERLKNSTSHARHCHTSSAIGEEVGRNLTINPSLDKAATESGSLIGHGAP